MSLERHRSDFCHQRPDSKERTSGSSCPCTLAEMTGSICTDRPGIALRIQAEPAVLCGPSHVEKKCQRLLYVPTVLFMDVTTGEKDRPACLSRPTSMHPLSRLPTSQLHAGTWSNQKRRARPHRWMLKVSVRSLPYPEPAVLVKGSNPASSVPPSPLDQYLSDADCGQDAYFNQIRNAAAEE